MRVSDIIEDIRALQSFKQELEHEFTWQRVTVCGIDVAVRKECGPQGWRGFVNLIVNNDPRDGVLQFSFDIPQQLLADSKSDMRGFFEHVTRIIADNLAQVLRDKLFLEGRYAQK